MRTARTQVIVTLGNIFGAIPMSLLVDRLWIRSHGEPFLSSILAEEGVLHMNPVHSPTLPFAIMSGVVLWMSSLVAGWTANWMAFRNLEAAISGSFRLRRHIGPHRAASLPRFTGRHLPGIAGYAVLGFLLGFVPIFVTLTGIPLEVRHVTLAAASPVYDVDRLVFDGTLTIPDLGWAVVGLACVGIPNFSASFAAGLLVSIRARSLPGSARHGLDWRSSGTPSGTLACS